MFDDISLRVGVSIFVAALIVGAYAPHVRAQDGKDRGWVRQFDSVRVEKVKPGDLPKTRKPGSETIIRTESTELPKPVTKEGLRKMVEHLDRRVVQVVSVQTPPKPYRQVPMVHHGHALWLAPPGGGTPALVSPLSWLKEADAVYVLPREDAEGVEIETSWKSRRRTLSSVTAGNKGQKWLDTHKDKLVAVKPHRPDKHRNLVTLLPEDGSLKAPSSGIEIFDYENKALFRLYGYSPFFGKSLTQTTMKPTHPEDRALAFYWQTAYPAILGAPLVSQDGKLVAINTFRHPKEEKIFLAIPTGAIASYLTPDGEGGEEE